MVGEDYKTGTSYKFRVPLRDSSGTLQSGKTASVTIYLPNDTAEPSPPTVTEIGSSGVYAFSYTPQTEGAYTFILSATGCLPVVWTVQVRGLSRNDLALENGGNLAAVKAATDAYLDAAVSSRAPAATALSNVTWTDDRAAKLDNLDTTVSSRAPADTALSNATWTDTRAAKLDNLDATVSSRAVPGDAMTLTTGERTSVAQAVWSAASRTLTSFGTLVSDVWSFVTRTITGGTIDTVGDKTGYSLVPDYDAAKTAASATYYTPERAAKLDNLDAAVSSRAPVGEYDEEMARLDVPVSSRAPAGEYNEELARLDVPVSSRACPGDAMSLTPAERAAIADAVLDEDVQSAPATASSLRAAAKAAWAQGFGRWTLVGTTLTLYGPDGATPVRVFVLDDPDSPTERVPA